MRFSPIPRDPRRRHRSGLTLLELLVVVAILAVLATVAIRSTSDFGQQARYDATQTTLKTFRDAVLGPANQVTPTGTPLVTGFIADMGRPPRSVNVSGVLDIPELYAGTLPTTPADKAYGLYAATSANVISVAVTGVSLTTTTNFTADSTLLVPAGWRGPYLTKSSAIANFQDGWGKALVSRIDLGTTTSAINTWPTMLLMPATGSGYTLPANSAYTAVIAANSDVLGWWTQSGFEGAPASTGDAYAGNWLSVISTNEYRIPLTVTVTVNTNTYTGLTTANRVQIGVFGPDPNMSSDNKPVVCFGSETTYPAAGNTINFSLTGTNAPTIGVRVFRAWLRTNTTTWAAGSAVYFPIRSGVQQVNVTIP